MEELSKDQRKVLYRQVIKEANEQIHGLCLSSYLAASAKNRKRAVELAEERGMQIYKAHGKYANKDRRLVLFNTQKIISISEVAGKQEIIYEDFLEFSKDVLKRVKANIIKIFVVPAVVLELNRLAELGYQMPFAFLIKYCILLDYKNKLSQITKETFESFDKRDGKIFINSESVK